MSELQTVAGRDSPTRCHWNESRARQSGKAARATQRFRSAGTPKPAPDHIDRGLYVGSPRGMNHHGPYSNAGPEPHRYDFAVDR
jgi:hypothetical protein